MKRLRPRSIWAAVVIVLPAYLPSATASEPATRAGSEPAARKVTFPLAGATKQPLSNYTLDELVRMWPAFKHAPIDTAGFNHFTLPFRYASDDDTGNRREARAFSFLLSHSLDWAPGGYCTRHAYFVFKRERKRMLQLERQYDRKLISFLVKGWSATHAVGGELRRSKAGYTGTLEIYDRTGKLVLDKDYDRPVEFFELLGDMSVDGIRFFGGKASASLVEHLHLKRCKHHESLIDLGEAAFAEEKSDEEFDIYKKILKRDPGFADVRYWWANQKWWHDEKWGHYEHQIALALNSYLVEAPLVIFDAEDCPDKEMAKRYPQWLKEAEKLVGADFPDLLKVRVSSAVRKGRISSDLLLRATAAASRYPNNFWMLDNLAHAYRNGGEMPADPAMAASIHLTRLRSRYLTGRGSKQDATRGFAYAIMGIGRNDICVQMMMPVVKKKLQKGGPSEVDWDARLLAEALEEMGWYAEAIKYYRIAFKGFKKDEPARNRALVEAGIAAAISGRDDILAQILRDRSAEAGEAKMKFLLTAYRDALAGKPIDTAKVRKKAWPGVWWAYAREVEFYAQIDLLAGRNVHRDDLTNVVRMVPADRSSWILFDAYDRAKPRPESASFYESLEWLHGHDPWVRQAVKDFRRRSTKKIAPDADELLKRLKDYKPVRRPQANPSAYRAMETLRTLPPGAVEVAIHNLLTKRRFDKARELALRYHNLAVQRQGYSLRVHANHLIHLVEQARQAAAGEQEARADRYEPRPLAQLL